MRRMPIKQFTWQNAILTRGLELMLGLWGYKDATSVGIDFRQRQSCARRKPDSLRGAQAGRNVAIPQLLAPGDRCVSMETQQHASARGHMCVWWVDSTSIRSTEVVILRVNVLVRIG